MTTCPPPPPPPSALPPLPPPPTNKTFTDVVAAGTLKVDVPDVILKTHREAVDASETVPPIRVLVHAVFAALALKLPTNGTNTDRQRITATQLRRAPIRVG
jgi:hypothetical protein